MAGCPSCPSAPGKYAQHYFAKTEPKAWEIIVQIEAKLN